MMSNTDYSSSKLLVERTITDSTAYRELYKKKAQLLWRTGLTGWTLPLSHVWCDTSDQLRSQWASQAARFVEKQTCSVRSGARLCPTRSGSPPQGLRMGPEPSRSLWRDGRGVERTGISSLCKIWTAALVFWWVPLSLSLPLFLSLSFSLSLSPFLTLSFQQLFVGGWLMSPIPAPSQQHRAVCVKEMSSAGCQKTCLLCHPITQEN